MEYRIRPELSSDYQEVEKVVEIAFKDMAMSDGTEHKIVHRIRRSAAFIPQLSLVAIHDSSIVGHILLSKVQIISKDQAWDILSLAPVSVLPNFQKKGIGSALIREAHAVAKVLNYKVVCLVGHANYYPKFGYKPSNIYGIKFPFESPAKNCMVVELENGACERMKGMVTYPKAFFE